MELMNAACRSRPRGIKHPRDRNVRVYNLPAFVFTRSFERKVIGPRMKPRFLMKRWRDVAEPMVHHPTCIPEPLAAW